MSAPKYRVAHVITRLCRGGAQENTFHTVRLADTDRFEVDLISGPTSGPEGSIETVVRGAGIEILREPALVRNVAPFQDWRAIRGLARLFRARRYHIVHTHTSKAGFAGRLAAARTGIPVVVHTPHGHVFDGYFPAPLTRAFVRLERYAAARSDALIALTSRGMQDHLDQRIGRPEQWHVIFSGIDLSRSEAALAARADMRRALGVPDDGLLVGVVGRLEPVKGITYFVEAARLIADPVAEARFVVVGDGSLHRDLCAQAVPLGDRIVFLGLRDDAVHVMAAMDVLVLPSINEGMGRVLLEAGSVGVPVVATRVGGVPDVVQEGRTGLLVPPRDPAAIAEALGRLAGNREMRTRLGLEARRFIVPDFSMESMVRRIEALYERLIEEKQVDP